jgi:hypothetical protein
MDSDPAINPYQPPAADLLPSSKNSADYSVEGKHLLVRNGASLPERCLKTNAPATDCKRIKKTLHWVHPLVYLSLLANILILVILYFCLRKKCVLEFSISQGARKQHYKKAWGIAAFAAIGIAMLYFGAMDEQGTLIGGGALITLIALILACTLGNLIRVTQHKDGWFRIPGCGEDFLRSIENESLPPQYPNS